MRYSYLNFPRNSLTRFNLKTDSGWNIYFIVQIRELAAWLLLRFFPSSFSDDVAALRARTKQLVHSPRVQEAQMGALMMKVLLQK